MNVVDPHKAEIAIEELCKHIELLHVELTRAKADNARLAGIVIKVAGLCGWKRHHEKGDPDALEWWRQDGSFAIADDLPLALRDLIAPTVELVARAEIAMDRWVATYAPEFCNPTTVNNARTAMWDSGGQLAYMTNLRAALENELDRLRAVMDPERKDRP